jgi:UDP-N-acetyl-alpha-D-muramoyl-L-alanyl-L-glutamate epimerase
MQNSLSFVFRGHKADLGKGKVDFNYEIKSSEETLSFTEKISFPPVKSEIPQDLLDSILNNLMIILGISYWKLYCPEKIVIENNFLSKKQADFWNTVYTKGLGEFFYKNKIDFRGLINFPSAKQNMHGLHKSIIFPRKERYLVGIGGGKDSVVSAEILRQQNKEFDLATSGFPVQIEIAEKIGGRVINIKREIDPKLFEQNKKQGVYNGHIPVSAYYAFVLLLLGALFDYKYIVVGNEKSANIGNVEYLGEMVNHQWSKSEEFEKLFNQYVKEFITEDIKYFSPLRDMTELEVVKEFVKYPKYFRVFASCNTNYKILKQVQNDNKKRWCGECAKCLFVFICLSAFLPKKQVMDIFGKNLFEDKALIPLFEELIGVRNFKPFECVGTPEETKQAMNKIVEKGEFSGDILFNRYLVLQK